MGRQCHSVADSVHRGGYGRRRDLGRGSAPKRAGLHRSCVRKMRHRPQSVFMIRDIARNGLEYLRSLSRSLPVGVRAGFSRISGPRDVERVPVAIRVNRRAIARVSRETQIPALTEAAVDHLAEIACIIKITRHGKRMARFPLQRLRSGADFRQIARLSMMTSVIASF